jgi:heme/copper-type cytochrome/quinol oxidase subunit 4
MKRVSKITLWVLFAISIVLTVLYFLNTKGANLDAWTYTYLNWAYIMVGLALLLIILLPILTFRQRTVKVKSLLILLVIAVVLVGGAYLLAPGTPISLATGKVVEGSSVKLTDTALYLTYFLLALAAISIIGGSVYNALKKN